MYKLKPNNFERFIITILFFFMFGMSSRSVSMYMANFSCESEDNYLIVLGYIEKSKYANTVSSSILYSVWNY